MSNRDLARKIVHHMTGSPITAQYIVQELANTGLLAPDLPEPRIDIDGWREWGHKHGNSVALENGRITVHIPDELSRDLTPAEARELATWLNAAAHAQQGDTK